MKHIALISALIFFGLMISCNPDIRNNEGKDTTSHSQPKYPEKSISITSDQAYVENKKIRSEMVLDVHEDLSLSLWAPDTLAMDPVAISIDQKTGNLYYSRAMRLATEFDIRNHTDWMTESISWQSVEDRRAFLRETFKEDNEDGRKFLKDLNLDGTLDWRDLTTEKEEIWFLSDVNNDGIADKSQLYIADFNSEISDLANGVEYYDGNVFIPIGPDMWRTGDNNGDGIADYKKSIIHGYAVHIGFGAHSMSGAIVGPDGRIWWGIGDIGMNVVDFNGNRWKYPNQGVIVRSEFDGSGFEVYSAGLRKTHEFAFDKYGNLISVDNDGDHFGESERLVYLINGSDSGWRINWQFGKYTDPDNNSYKVWMDEKMYVPHWEGQAAYILPPIVNYVNGPTGLVYNPGTALDSDWEDHFFVSEFRGSASISPLHAFTLEPNGASFNLKETKIVTEGLLPTGLDFGPDGALYVGDWVIGWDIKRKGRIWKLDTKSSERSKERLFTKRILESDMPSFTLDSLATLLKNPDMRIRQRAQFELVKRKSKGLEIFNTIINEADHQLSRIHAIWGISQMARTGEIQYSEKLIPLLNDTDPEIVTQAAKMLGDVKYKVSASKLIPLLTHESLRVRLHATEALGRMDFKDAFEPIIKMLQKNNNEDIWLRHAGVIALARIASESSLVNLKDHSSKALRLAATVSLRRQKSSKIEEFLFDKDEGIVTEASRAINDDYSIIPALPALANILNTTSFSNEPLLRRSINANLRVGQYENIKNLIEFSTDVSNPEEMRAEAIYVLANWEQPSVLDRVDGRYRGELNRNPDTVIGLFSSSINNLLQDPSEMVQVATITAISKFHLENYDSVLLSLFQNSISTDVRIRIVKTLNTINSDLLDELFELAALDTSSNVRAEALHIINNTNITDENAIRFLSKIITVGSLKEKQKALLSLGFYSNIMAVEELKLNFNNLVDEKLNPSLELELGEAILKQNNPKLVVEYNQYLDDQFSIDSLSIYKALLFGGDAKAGEQIYYWNQSAQCQRCHGLGSAVQLAGPDLLKVSSRLSRIEILESLVKPSNQITNGYGFVTVELRDNYEIYGILVEEDSKRLAIKTGEGEIEEIDRDEIINITNHLSSMPSMVEILTKNELRDLVAFLETL